nr:type IV pilus assembly protein PilM [Legionella sp. PL877]
MDINATSVRAVLLSGTKNNYYVVDARESDLLPGVIINDKLENMDGLVHCLKSLFSKPCPPIKSVVLAVPDSMVITKTIQIGRNVSNSEIEKAVLTEASKHLSYSVKEIYLDFLIQGSSTANHAMLDILVIACKAENITSRVDAVSRAGLVTRVVEIESRAIEYVASLLVKELAAKEHAIAFIRQNGQFTYLNVLYQGKIIFTHEERFGNTPLLEGWNAVDQKIHNCHPDFIVLQIKRMLQFFSSQTHLAISHLFLTDNITKKTCLTGYIQEKLGISTSLADPFKQMIIAKELYAKVVEMAPCFLIACGMAIRGLD